MKSKKLLLGSLSAMALVATPIATVVSCGGNGSAAAGDKKAVFSAADVIKKIKADDKGVIATIPGMPTFYLSEADAKKETTLDMAGNKLKFPALTDAAGKAKTGTLKMEMTFTDEALAAHKKIASSNVKGTAAQKKAAADAVKRVQSHDFTVANVAAEGFVINKIIVATTLKEIEGFLPGALTMKEGKGIYPFAFKEASLNTVKPELTVESKTAFDKIFTDLGLTVTALEFEKAKADSKEIKVETLTIIKTTVATKSTAADLTALKVALGNTIAVTRTAAVSTTSTDASIKAKGKTMTAKQLISKLKSLISGTAHIGAIPTLLNEKIKDDMVITFSITTAAVAGSAQGATPPVAATPGAAVIKINAAGANEVTVPVTLTP